MLLGLVLPPLLAVYVIVIALVLDMDRPYGQYALIVPVSYVLGSIPWGFLISLLAKGVDIRKFGSGRTGMSNVLRTAGGRYAVVALVLDLSKGLLAVLLARAVADEPAVEVAAGLSALIGHNWSVFLGFKGGRGIATGLGGILVMAPIAGGIAIAAFIMVTVPTKYVSLGSICSVLTAFLSLLALVLLDHSPATYLLYSGVGGAIIIWQHRDNIQRILNGTERRLGQRAERLGLDQAQAQGQQADGG